MSGNSHHHQMIKDKFLFFDAHEALFLTEVLETRQLSGTSDWVAQYENALATYFGLSYAVALSSGSAALHTALYILGAVDGAEVLIPATAPLPSLLPLLTAKARPVFVDTNPTDFGFDLEDLQRKITSRTKAALIVPVWGYPFSLRETLAVLNAAGIPLIEDIAQAHGTIIGGRKAGTWGTISCLSTHDRKLLATGEGGALLTNDKDLYLRAKQFSQLGYMDGQSYGVNYKLSTLQCALGLSRLPYLNMQIQQRRANAHFIAQALTNHLYMQELPIPERCEPNYYSLVLYLFAQREQVRRFIIFLDEKGIPSDVTRYGYDVAYHRPLFRPFFQGMCPHAEALVRSITTIPVHPDITNQERERTIEALREGYSLLSNTISH